jgi:hypothetical protein
MDNMDSIMKSLSHIDTEDREVAKDFLEKNNWVNIEMGGEYDLDLEVHQYKRGCDVEMIKYDMDYWKHCNHFRIPYRKHKYWSELPTYNDKNGNARINMYKDWYVDYIQFLNNDLDEFLWYDWKLVKEYKDNIYFDNYLHNTKGWTEIRSTFITIPYEIGLNRIKHYKKMQDGVWWMVIHTNK